MQLTIRVDRKKVETMIQELEAAFGEEHWAAMVEEEHKKHEELVKRLAEEREQLVNTLRPDPLKANSARK